MVVLASILDCGRQFFSSLICLWQINVVVVMYRYSADV